jgi:hypothetical protein
MNIEQIISSRPDTTNIGGSAPWKMRHLYEICKRLQPNLIIESGTWKGNSLWLLRKAFINSEIHSYDIDYSHLLWKDKTITYHNYDISIDNKKFNPKYNDVIFFDDHINQKERLEWAYNNGFKNLVFDDNVPSSKLEAFGMPPIPTISMLQEQNRIPNYVDYFVILDYDNSDISTRNKGQTYLTYLKIKN